MASRIGLKTLVTVCRRTATSHEAGLDARTIWKRESQSGSPAHRRAFERVSQAIDGGATLADALGQADGYLPPLVRDMVHVGEQTGRVDDALDRLANYYDHIRILRGTFLAGIAWPILQFAVAVLLIGAVIWLRGFLPGDYDMVGLGLSGTGGALSFFIAVGVFVMAGYLFVRSLIRGRLSTPVMSLLMRVPYVGRWLQLMAMSRMTWSLGLSVDSGMNAKDCARIALRSTQNQHFISHSRGIEKAIGRGETLYDAFSATEVFSQDFLDAVQVGEETGRLGESMEVLSKRYEQQGKTAMQALTAASGILIWVLVAGVIIFFIFKFALFYVGLYDEILNF